MDNFPLELNESDKQDVLMSDAVQLVSDEDINAAANFIDNVAKQCEETQNAIVREVHEYFQACMDSCRDTDSNCFGCLFSLLEDVKRKVDGVSLKCENQLMKAVKDRVSIAVESIASLGVQLPTPDEVSAIGTGELSPKATEQKIILQPSLQADVTSSLTPDNIKPLVGDDSKVNPPLVCKGTDITYTAPNGQITCLDNTTGTITTQDPQGNISVTHFPPPKPPGGGGGATVGNTTDTGGDSGAFSQCAEGTTLTTSNQCFGDPNPKSVWYVVRCGENGQAILDTYQGWNKPDVDPNSIIASGLLTETPPPSGDQIIAFAAKFCTATTDKPKPVEKPHGSPTLYCDPDKLAKAVKDTQSGGGVQELFTSDNNLFLNFKCDDFSRVNPLRYVCDIVQFVLNYGVSIANGVATNYSCLNDEFATSAVNGAALGAFGGWFGLIPESFKVTNQYSQNLACQFLLPGTGEAVSLNTRGWLTDEQFRGLAAANGMCLPWAEKLRDASYNVPGIAETISLYRRERIEVDEFRDLMRKNGIKDEDMMDRFRWATEFTFGPQDLITFMKRDVFDDNVVQKYGYDQEFDDKFTDQAEKFAAAVGVTKDQMKNYWLSHWQIPGDQRLFEMVHRLRDDYEIPGSDLVAKKFTIDDLAEALKINDVAPEFVNRLIAITYRIPNKIDIRRAYEIGDIEPEDLQDKYQDMGYAEKDAEAQANFTKENSADRRANLTGQITRKDIYALFMDDALSHDDALELLLNTNYKPQYAIAKLDSLSSIRDAKNLAKNIKMLKSAYLKGRYDRGEVQQILNEFGVSGDRISGIVDQWNTELTLKSKEVAIASLCKWFSLGYITGQDYLQRVKRLGYTDEDAANFVNACSNDIAVKRAKELQAEVKAAKAEAEKQKKEAIARAKELAPCKPPPKPVCGKEAKAK